MTKKKKDNPEELMGYWRNLKLQRFFVKGERDNPTWKEAVLASKQGNYFGPGAVYWGFIPELPAGTYYVTGELDWQEV